MQFIQRKRRAAPAVIIISLIDIMMVLLIFLMITTSFKKLPALKLTLPETTQPVEGITEANLVVTVSTNAPFYYLGEEPVSLEALRERLNQIIRENPVAQLSIRPDTESAVGDLVTVMDVAKEAHFQPDAVKMIIKRRPKAP